MPRISALADLTLPLLPETAAALDASLALRKTRNADLQRILLSDPAAAIAVLRAVARRKPETAEDLVDLAHAVSLLGQAGLDTLMQDTPVLNEADAARSLALRQHYAHAAHAAHYARAWATLRGWANAEGVAMAALLHNPAPLALAAADPESALRALNAAWAGVPWQIAYGAELGHDVRTANVELCRQCTLPRTVTAALRLAASATPAARLAAVAADLGRTTSLGWHPDETSLQLETLAQLLEVEHDAAGALLSRQAVEAARELAPLGYPTAAFDLLRLSGETGLDAEEEARLQTVLARQARKQAEASRADARRAAQVAITRAMRGMLEDTGVVRSVFFMLTRDRRNLHARLALGTLADDPLRELVIGLSGKHLFDRLLLKPQSIWVHAENREKYAALLPVELRQLDRRGEFFAMSLIVEDRPVGVFFGEGERLSEDCYRRFRGLCRDASAAVAGNRHAA
jgi:hypothetical protein